MHGAGNDFVVLDGRAEDLPELANFCHAYADRNFGVGFDQLLVLRESEHADYRMEIWNAEGGEVEMCGNGIRAFFKYIRDRGCLLYTSPSPRDGLLARMPSSA